MSLAGNLSLSWSWDPVHRKASGIPHCKCFHQKYACTEVFLTDSPGWMAADQGLSWPWLPNQRCTCNTRHQLAQSLQQGRQAFSTAHDLLLTSAWKVAESPSQSHLWGPQSSWLLWQHQLFFEPEWLLLQLRMHNWEHYLHGLPSVLGPHVVCHARVGSFPCWAANLASAHDLVTM